MGTKRIEIGDRIIIDPEILVGKPVVRGTRIPVALVLKCLSQDLSLMSLFASYPHLSEDDVRACLKYAHDLVAEEELYPLILDDATPDPAQVA